jgi:hypothetical protein
MSWPSHTLTNPSDVDPSRNGLLLAGELKDVFAPGLGLGKAHHQFARAFRALQFQMWAETGQSLTFTSLVDLYRPYAVQETVFRQRCTTKYNPITCQAPSKRKWWNGEWWYLKRLMAQCATPGKSNHGNGMAGDMGYWVEVKPGQFRIMGLNTNSLAAAWALQHFPTFGFYWNVSTEFWHLEFCMGDEIPQRVLDVEAMIGPPDWIKAA